MQTLKSLKQVRQVSDLTKKDHISYSIWCLCLGALFGLVTYDQLLLRSQFKHLTKKRPRRLAPVVSSLKMMPSLRTSDLGFGKVRLALGGYTPVFFFCVFGARRCKETGSLSTLII